MASDQLAGPPRDQLHAGVSTLSNRRQSWRDRWFSVDDRRWHSGGLPKDLGRKWTRISQIDHPGQLTETTPTYEVCVATAKRLARQTLDRLPAKAAQGWGRSS